MMGLALLGFAVQVATSTLERADGLVLGMSVLNILCCLALWYFGRGRLRSIYVLRAAEVVFVLASTVVSLVMVRFVMVVMVNSELTAGPSAPGQRLALAFSEMLGLSFVFGLRAPLVPSPARYTALITAAAAPILVLGLALLWPSLPGEVGELETAQERPVLIGNVLIWWSLLTVMCTTIAGVVHGLRNEVRAARQLGQYLLLAKIGEGGMGAVYKAQHAMMKRPTAVKLLPPNRTSHEQVGSQADRRTRCGFVGRWPAHAHR